MANTEGFLKNCPNKRCPMRCTALLNISPGWFNYYLKESHQAWYEKVISCVFTRISRDFFEQRILFEITFHLLLLFFQPTLILIDL